VATIHRYARGIPRVTNLLCEHSLVSAFVDQKNPVPPETVEEVAHDFELDVVDPTAQAAPPTNGFGIPPAHTSGNHSNSGDQPQLIESLMQALNSLVDRLNQAEAAIESERERKQ
jgi:hypothetical protein